MTDKISTAGELLDLMQHEFRQHGMEEADAEAVAILAELLDCDRLRAKLDRSRQIPDELCLRGLEIIRRRLTDEPWQYIFQRAYFRDLTLKVNPSVLIPRPETEVLVDWCLQQLPENGHLLDIGTGSGAIALSVATERRDAIVTACDISSQALETARANQLGNAVNNVNFVQSDLFSALTGKKFDLIAANLPYVTESEYAALSPEVRNHEPKLALTSGDDGLDLIRQTINQAHDFLKFRGAIILEMSPWQTDIAAQLFSEALCWTAIEILRDYTGRNRFVAARLR